MTRRPLLATLLACLALCAGCVARSDFEGSPRKVYVILGFHSNFYHSWRGDTPDEAGFGTDIRVVWNILRLLDLANHDGLQAVAYWDTDNHFTYETILSRHAQQIIRAIQRRVDLGLDEVVPAPYNNGLFGAMTPEEVRAALRWSISNPWGSGLRDLFGTYTPLIRPNEAMTTTGLAPLLLEEGIQGIVLAYSGWPFNGFSTFVPTLPPEQRYNPTWLRLEEGGPRIVLFPCVSIGDVLNQISLERWMLDLRRLQVSGEVDRDLVIHINFDSDVETWLPRKMPPGLGWFPNSGGLPEYIRAVNKYDWAEFTTPGRYLAEHEPVGELRIRRDLADGAFDGHYSWAEKFPSHAIWTTLEGSRLATERAEALALTAPAALREQARAELWEGRDSSFFQRLRGLSTTHFGMSTPLVNEERQAVAESIVGDAQERASGVERRLAAAAARAGPAPDSALYAFELRDLRVASGRAQGAVRTLLRIPLLLPLPLTPLELVDEEGQRVPASLVNVEELPGGLAAAELWFCLPLAPAETRRVALQPAQAWPAGRAGAGERLASGPLELRLAPGPGIASLRLGDWQVGGEDFLEPFVSYRSDDEPVTYRAEGFERLGLEAEQLDGLQRARLRASIPFETPDGQAQVALRVDLGLPDALPWVVADVEVAYPYTQKRDLLHTLQQKLRRPLDLRWVEVAPFPLRPRFEATRAEPLRIWKHNWLDVTSSYELDYARVNPRNAELDAFNHQVTAGWVAASDGRHGLLLAYDADRRASHAFAPMRLRERDGRQVLQINPFGSYYGRQLDYSHLGGTGIGTEFTTLASSALRPNGPSYDGESEGFSLLLAPYRGDAPPAWLRAEAQAFFHPPAVVVLRAPEGVGQVLLARDLRHLAESARRAGARLSRAPLPAPPAFLANPTEGAVDLVWDEVRDARVDGYDVEWRAVGTQEWQRAAIAPARRHRVDGLPDASAWDFRVRARGAGLEGPWSPVREAAVGPVEAVDALDAVEGAPLWLLLRTFYYGLVHLATTP